MKNIKVDKVILYYMDRVDPDGNQMVSNVIWKSVT